GSLLPAFVLIPIFGSRDAFLALAIALLLPSSLALLATGATARSAVAAGIAVALIAFPFISDRGLIRPPDSPGAEVIAERETPYNYIQVVQQGPETMLVLNDGHAVHSIYNPTADVTRGPWQYFLVGKYFVPNTTPEDIDSLLMIGLAAGTVSKQFTDVYGPIPIDGVEIDGGIVDVAREHFEMNEPNLDVYVEDGRYFLERTANEYDVVSIDAYRQPYIPFHLTTRQFFESVEEHMTADGAAIVNAGRTHTDFRLVEVIAATMDAVFDSVYLIDVEGYSNTMVVGINGPSSVEDFRDNVSEFEQGTLLGQVARSSLTSGNVREWEGDGQVFTDDHAPVELVVDQIILEEAQAR
ncbi:MAG: spermidine synthase, partial [Chloroflexota bacterium]